MSIHVLKVRPPYFNALADGSKRFEVRKNDRAYQTGDVVELGEWHAFQEAGDGYGRCELDGCEGWRDKPHWHTEKDRLKFSVTFVYSGDPRFGGIEPGHVVIALGGMP